MAMETQVVMILAMVMLALMILALGTLAMVMVSVRVFKVSEALRQLGWLRQHYHQSFRILRALYYPMYLQTKSFPATNSFPWKTLLLALCGSLK
jgi:hypothetical protein